MEEKDNSPKPYSLEEKALDFELDNPIYGTEHNALELAGSLYNLSEMLGHNDKNLKEAVGYAQQFVGNEQNISEELRAFEVDSSSVEEATNYLQMIKDKSKICLSQAKVLKDDDLEKFKHIDRLINSVSAINYKEVTF